MKESTILKLCKRATKNNPKSVKIISNKERVLRTTQGTYKVFKCESNWHIEQISVSLEKLLYDNNLSYLTA